MAAAHNRFHFMSEDEKCVKECRKTPIVPTILCGQRFKSTEIVQFGEDYNEEEHCKIIKFNKNMNKVKGNIQVLIILNKSVVRSRGQTSASD